IVDGYLPTADIVFLDEIWKASPPIQNALLTALNEKLYRNGRQELRLPVKGFIAASNELPEPGEGLEAFWDRFLIRLPLTEIVDDGQFAAMVEDRRDPFEDRVPVNLKITAREYAAWQTGVDDVKISADTFRIADAIRRRMREENEHRGDSDRQRLFVSDRRWKKIFRLLRASAFLNGRTETDAMDCFIIAHCIWNRREEEPVVRDFVNDAISSHGYSIAADPKPIADGLARLKRDVEQTTLEVTEQDELRPALFEGEYILLRGFSPDHHVRIWKGDYDSLPESGSEGIELFFFSRDGSYDRTEHHEVARGGPSKLLIDGKPHAIETERRRSTVTLSHAPPKEALDRWNRRTEELIDQGRSLLERITSYQEAERQEAEANLFVPRARAEIAFTSLRLAAKEVARLTVEIEKNRKYYESLG
ncbi:AAA family ATPase, partial [Salinispira pacifica]